MTRVPRVGARARSFARSKVWTGARQADPETATKTFLHHKISPLPAFDSVLDFRFLVQGPPGNSSKIASEGGF